LLNFYFCATYLSTLLEIDTPSEKEQQFSVVSSFLSFLTWNLQQTHKNKPSEASNEYN